jgi:hypothetical protein
LSLSFYIELINYLPLSAKSFYICEKLLKTGEIGSSRLSKSASWLLLAFKIGQLALASFQNQRPGSGRLKKLSVQLREICYPIGAKDLNSPVLKSFSL